MKQDNQQPLQGLKVLEMGTLLAGPFAARILAEFGAEVIKIESPKGGDPLRSWRKLYKGTSLWWYVQSRNKKSITLDLKQEEAQEIVRELVKEADIVIENFRPGTLEKWNLGWNELASINPGLVMVRTSGYGQTGPYRDNVGYGAIGESMGGLRYLTGFPDRAPVRVGISIGDSLSGLYGVIGALIAIYHKKVNGGKGQYIDVALYESVFSLMESLLPEYSVLEHIRERTGSSLPGIVPSNTYPCQDGNYLIIAANGDSIFKRCMNAIGRDDLANDPGLADNEGRVKRVDELDNAITEWTMNHDSVEALSILKNAQVPVGNIYSIKDIVEDPHYQAREMIQEWKLNDGQPIKIPGIVPKLNSTPGETKWLGPELGEHTKEVLKSIGISEEKYRELKIKGIV